MVLDDLCDVVAPLTAVACKEGGADEVTLVTRWPMIGMETILDVYLDWILPKLYQTGVTVCVDHFVRRIEGDKVTLYNVHHDEAERTIEGRLDRHGDWPALRERAAQRGRRARRLGRDHRRRNRAPHRLRGGLRRPPPGPQALILPETTQPKENLHARCLSDFRIASDRPGSHGRVRREGRPLVAAYGGELVAATTNVAHMDGMSKPPRIVIIRFESMEGRRSGTTAPNIRRCCRCASAPPTAASTSSRALNNSLRRRHPSSARLPSLGQSSGKGSNVLLMRRCNWHLALCPQCPYSCRYCRLIGSNRQCLKPET